MELSSARWFCRVATLASLAGGACLAVAAPAPPPGADKIEFSNHRDSVKLPDASEGRDLTKAFESLQQGNSMSGVLEPLGDGPGPIPLPQGSPDQRMLELLWQRLDQKKNWIYARPENLTSTPTAEEVMQVRSYDLDGAGKPRDGMSDFFEGKGALPSTTSLLPLDGERSDSPVLFDPQFDSGLRLGSTLLLPGNPLDARQRGPADPLLPDAISQQTAAPAGNNPAGLFSQSPIPTTPEVASVPISIRGLLGTANGMNPLAAGFDPINLRADTTRQEINPVTGRSLRDLPLEKRMDVAGPLATPGAGTYDRSSPLQEMESKILGSSSLAPAVAAPVGIETPRPIVSRPGTLQLPTRKF